MDSQVSSLVNVGVSMIQSSGTEPTDQTDLPELSESTSLSPLTNSLDHHLTIQEDNQAIDSNMGIENTWAEANCSSSNCAIPLPPPPSCDDFADVGADPLGDETGVEHGPFLPPTSTLNNIFGDTVDIQDDTTIEVSTPAGVCGLRNLGNTCFMAAGLQCLTASPTVLGHFLDLEKSDDKLPPPGSLMAHFSTLLSKMWSGRYSVVRPIEFKQTLGAYHSQFKDYRQHDCQEFLALLLDSLHEQMNTANSGKVCHVPATTVNTNCTNKYNEDMDGMVDQIDTAMSSFTESLMDTFDNSPSSNCPNSPIDTMAGSPRDSLIDDLDSLANSPTGSPMIDDIPDADDILETQSSFIHNKMEHTNYQQANCNGINYNELYDIIKDAKTSNANFLVTSQDECINDINYDSVKFTKSSTTRNTKIDNTNLIENHNFDNKLLTTKRINDVNNEKTDCLTIIDDNDLNKCNVKRMKLDDNEKNSKKNIVFNDTNNHCLNTILNCENGAIATNDEVEADKYWAKHIKTNKSVIVDTFQGQFKSTVVCAECKHVSVTYEPFMYLSVPLPHAMERQLTVTYVPASNEPAIRCVVSLNKQSRISKLKEELIKLLGMEHTSSNNIAFAEVLEDHIARILDDNMQLRHVNDTNRLIYAFELTEPPDAYTSTPDGGGDRLTDTELCQNGTNVDGVVGQCTICLEELDGDLKRHDENNCQFIICHACIETYYKTPKEPQPCPMCHVTIEASSFTKIDQTGRPRPAIRILNVPIVLRHDTNEAPNNRKGTKLFGNLHLVRLPSRVDAKDLHEFVKRVVPQEKEYTVHFVDGQGHHCSRCMWNAHCTGCSVPETGMVTLVANDTLAVRYTESLPKQVPPIDHISITKQRPQHPLSLYDCLQAFSQSEVLDEHNPWFCPKCERNQCATKTLTVHRYPQYLIVYLKRFVFHECVSMKLDNKVTFPLAGLNVGRHLYDLYACVCHFGGVSAGHYTAYAKNPRTDIWHYYNDEITSRQKPQEEDFSNAYILFYSRQGTNNSKPSNI